MPLLKANIQDALRAAGLSKAGGSAAGINEKLDEAGLSDEEVLDQVAQVMMHGSSDSIRLRAAETVLKVRGHMKEASAPPPPITIVIQGTGVTPEVNPILIPREISPIPKETVQ